MPRSAMQLPFTKEQFLSLFAAYNDALWPAVATMWIVTALVCMMVVSRKRRADRWMSALLVAHWTWSALAYHVAFFTRINPAAWMFAALFLVQAVLFFWEGVVQRRLAFAGSRDEWSAVAWLAVAYALVYPGVNAIQHVNLSTIPTFGVPCPTTIFTAGMLILAEPRSWRISVIPLIWSAIGGSAAILFDVPADYALPIAGAALAVSTFRRHHSRPTLKQTPTA